MFLVFGVRTIRRDVKGSALERERCARCGFFSDFRRQREQRYFTLFFLPVFPMSKADPVLTCNRCGTSYYTNFYPGQLGAEMDAGLEKAVLLCPACTGKMRVPLKPDKPIRVTCPNCRDQFTVTVDRSS